ncbi:MAG: tetratricopeptide repeat protein [Ferruginibacter sp.]
MKLIPLTIFAFLFLTITYGQKIDSLLEVVSQNNRDIEHVKAMNNLAAEYMRNDVSKAKVYLFGMLALSKTIRSENYESAAYTQLISFHNNNANADSATYYLDRLATLSNSAKGPDKNYVAANYYAAAGLFHKKTGNLPLAIEFMKKAINAASKTSNRSNIAGQLMNLGNTYNLVGDFKNAIGNHLKALKIFEEENNARGQSFCYQNICNSFIELKQFSNALSYANKSLAIKKSLNDIRGTGTSENALGQIYQGLQKPDLALTHYKQALDIARNFKLVPEQAKLHYNIGKLFLIKKDTATALNSFEQSKSFALQLGDSSLISSVDVQFIAVKDNREKLAKTEQKLLTGMEKIQELGQLPKEVSGYEHIADYYAANKQFEKALEYTKKYYNSKDSLTNNELLGQIKSIEEQYNLDKKEKEIAILKKDQLLQQVKIEKQKLYQTAGMIFLALLILIAVLIINRYRTVNKSRQLLAMEKMRNGIARDLHDDIGSTLTSINILSKVMLQEDENKHVTANNNLLKIKDHSSSIMESMSDIVWAINPHNDTIEKLIYKMKELAAEVFDPMNIAFNFSVEGDFSQVKLTLDKRKDLYLIFKEAVNNTAKYSDCTQVNIALKHAERNIELHVSDNGRGFDEQTVKYGNGLRNIRERAKNMLASLKYNTSVGAGTDIELIIPLT